MNDSYRRDSAAILRELDVEAELGITHAEATRRLKEYGTNEIVERGIKNPWLISECSALSHYPPWISVSAFS